MIRLANKNDIDDIVRMSEGFWQNTVYDDPFCPESVASMAEHCINSGICYVYDNNGAKGFICAVIGHILANHSVLAASEVAWWVEPEYRNSKAGLGLIKALERSAKNKGVKYKPLTYI